MFGIDGFEFLIILIVMIVVVGPKDLPKMLRAFGQATTKMRKTAMEFRRHFDEAMREAELGDLSDTLKDMKKLDPRKNLVEIFDPIREVTSDIKASLNKPAATTIAAEDKETVLMDNEEVVLAENDILEQDDQELAEEEAAAENAPNKAVEAS